ncbi:MAG TPA: response regulator, partial [Chloroflexaceae bacterium]|nr:response regulator [Chloroflexaceae bacterium]
QIDPIRSWLGVPMLFGDPLVGMITLDKHEPGFYTAEPARLAAAFAAQAAAAMENVRLYEAAQRELRDRTRAEAAHARLAAIIEATTDLVGMGDMEGRILFLNQAARRALAIPDDDELAALRVADLYPERLHAWLRGEAVPAAVRDGSWSGETTLRQRDGGEVPVSQVIIAHKGPGGAPEFLSTIVRDMRERRRAEEELRQAQKMEALGRLAGGMAHDFNNLLTVILGEADMLLEDVPPRTPMAQSAEQIRQAGVRAAALTRQLLAFSRRQVLQPELIDLNAVVGAMEEMLRRLLGEDIALTIRLAPGLPHVRADPGQIEQVVMNLCINARDAMPAGGRLVVETAEALLGAEHARQRPEVAPGPYAMLAVSDTGAGMDEETQRHIFEPFFTTKARGKGTGLGLATVHGIVRQSGGHIWFASEPGQGSSFRVYLPTAPGVAAPEAPAPGAPLPRAVTETVLLVEDDDSVRALARGILARQGYTVIEAADGPAALAAAEAHPGPIDMLLTDVVMPGGLNGVQLAAALRGRRPQVRVVFMSGYADNAPVGQSLRPAGDRYLQKPFTPAQLARALAERMKDEG